MLISCLPPSPFYVSVIRRETPPVAAALVVADVVFPTSLERHQTPRERGRALNFSRARGKLPLYFAHKTAAHRVETPTRAIPRRANNYRCAAFTYVLVRTYVRAYVTLVTRATRARDIRARDLIRGILNESRRARQGAFGRSPGSVKNERFLRGLHGARREIREG